MINRKEISRFIFVGFGAVLTDFLIYNLSLRVFTISFSKVISFVCGSLVTFNANKLWTFEKKENRTIEKVKFSLLYSISLMLNTTTNKFIFDYSSDNFVAFMFATGLSTLINYIGQKYWVFK